MADDFDRRISVKRATLDGVKTDMERVRQDFMVAASEFVPNWYLSHANEAVQFDHETTSSLTDEKLRDLKSEVNALAANAQAVIEEFFSKPRLWWHLNDPLPTISEHHSSSDDPWRYSYYGNRAPDQLDKALRYAFGRVAQLLQKYGYLKLSKNKSGRLQTWEMQSQSGMHDSGGAQPYFAYSIDWSPEMRQKIEAYSTLQKSAVKLLQEIASLMEEKKRAHAKNRWDSI